MDGRIDYEKVAPGAVQAILAAEAYVKKHWA